MSFPGWDTHLSLYHNVVTLASPDETDIVVSLKHRNGSNCKVCTCTCFSVYAPASGTRTRIPCNVPNLPLPSCNTHNLPVTMFWYEYTCHHIATWFYLLPYCDSCHSHMLPGCLRLLCRTEKCSHRMDTEVSVPGDVGMLDLWRNHHCHSQNSSIPMTCGCQFPGNHYY